MWLLNTQSLTLEQVTEEEAPPYAILSHTWGEDEVTFQDMQGAATWEDSATKSKAGYTKIKLTCKAARRVGLAYAWVDTCCIDKSSSAELSESINSMFRWYSKARVCFAYLTDVPLVPFKSSHWFTRGWTLQELLAPRELEFYDSDWSRLGTRESLSKKISTITEIAERFLQPLGGSQDCYHDTIRQYLISASIAQRMSWASKRETTRVEDMAYCLLGIFDINMPLLYGEGKEAFIRLQEAILQRIHNDQSIFAWVAGRSSAIRGVTSILADWPSAFAECGSIVPCRMDGYDPDLLLTNKGVRLNIPLSMDPWKSGYVVLRCNRTDDPTNLLIIPVELSRGGVHFRVQDEPRVVPHTFWDQLPLTTVYLSVRPSQKGMYRNLDKSCIIVRADSSHFALDNGRRRWERDLSTGILLALAHSRGPPIVEIDKDDVSTEQHTTTFSLYTFSSKETLSDSSKLLCAVDTLEIEESFRNSQTPIHMSCLLAVAPSITSSASPSDTALFSGSPRIQWSDHIPVFEKTRVIYATCRAENVFGRIVYIVNIKMSSNRGFICWLRLRDLFVDVLLRARPRRASGLRLFINFSMATFDPIKLTLLLQTAHVWSAGL